MSNRTANRIYAKQVQVNSSKRNKNKIDPNLLWTWVASASACAAAMSATQLLAFKLKLERNSKQMQKKNGQKIQQQTGKEQKTLL